MHSVYEGDYPEIFRFIKEGKVAIYYSPSQRSFAIGGIEPHIRQEIYFCPWTGKKLPPSLSAKLSEKLEALNLSILERETWPEELGSEAWWINEGL